MSQHEVSDVVLNLLTDRLMVDVKAYLTERRYEPPRLVR
jgi:hypothetical protein